MSSISGSGSGPLSNLFCDAQSGPSKWAQAREAGMAAQKNQQNAFAGQMQSLVQTAAAQINTGDPDKRYTNALKMRHSVEQGVRMIENTEIAKASEVNLEAMEEQIKEKVKESQEKRAQEAKANGEAQTSAENGTSAVASEEVSRKADSINDSPSKSASVKAPQTTGYTATGASVTSSGGGASGNSDTSAGSEASSGQAKQVDVRV